MGTDTINFEDSFWQRGQNRIVQTNEKLVDLEKLYNVTLEQINGQRILRHSDNSVSPPTEDKCEIFVGKLPRNLLEDELYPIFAKIGTVYEARLMMDFSGTNRGFCFVKYTNPTDATNAIRYLDKLEILPGCEIGVMESVNNCKLVIEHLPLDIQSIDIIKEIIGIAKELKEVSVYKDLQSQVRFAIIVYKTHRDAAMARREFVPRKVNLFGKGVKVDWAQPDFQPNNVIEEKGTINDDGEITMHPPTVIQQKRSSKGAMQNSGKSPKLGHHYNKFDGKSKRNDIPNYSQRTAIREQKISDLSKKRLNRMNQNKKKNHKSKVETLVNEKPKSENPNLNGTFNGFGIEKYNSCADLSCKSSMISDTVSEPATQPMNFSLFDEFRFSRPTVETQSLCHDMFQSDNSEIDNLTSNFESHLCLDSKKTDVYGYNSSIQQPCFTIPACNISQHLQFESTQCYGSPLPTGYHQSYRDYHYDQFTNGRMAYSNSFYTCNHAPDSHQPIASSFEPRFSTQLPYADKYSISNGFYNSPHYSDISTSTMYPNGLHYQTSDPNRFLCRTRINANFLRSEPTFGARGSNYPLGSVSSLKSAGAFSRRSQALNANGRTTRTVQNSLNNIPPGARPILRSLD